jgi:PAS domain S-box-containing protein
MHSWWRSVSDPTQWLDLLDVLPEVYFFSKNLEHRFMRVNAACAALHGCSPEQMIGMRDSDFHPPALAEQYVEEDRAVMHSGTPLRDRIWLVYRTTGEPCWFLSSKFPLRDKRGAIAGIAGVMRAHHAAAGAEDRGPYDRLTPALDHVLTHYGTALSMESLAQCCHLSLSQMQREFQRCFGTTPSAYLLNVRLLMARWRLKNTEAPLGSIALECGFYDQSHFTRAFQKAHGISPLQYRKSALYR